jgi:hypothetical protein
MVAFSSKRVRRLQVPAAIAGRQEKSISPAGNRPSGHRQDCHKQEVRHK